eukprot:1027237-Prorocentrum_minimum.AAC.2
MMFRLGFTSLDGPLTWVGIVMFGRAETAREDSEARVCQACPIRKSRHGRSRAEKMPVRYFQLVGVPGVFQRLGLGIRD